MDPDFHVIKLNKDLSAMEEVNDAQPPAQKIQVIILCFHLEVKSSKRFHK